MTAAVVWVQHLLGTGHTVRAAALARALAREGVDVTLVLGARAPATLDIRGLQTVELPPVTATDASFRTIVGEDGTPYEALAPIRARAFAETVARVRPRIVVTETFPLGRRRFADEIVPVLSGLPAGTLVAASVRDVLVRKGPRKEREMAALARAWFRLVLVHADPAFVRLEDSFGATGEIAHLVRYTGFLREVTPVAPEAAEGSGEIVVSAGGGAVGAPLVEAAMGAARLVPGRRWRILVAPGLCGRLDGWRDSAPAGVVLEPNRPDFRQLLARAALSVSQAGYNTVLDVLEAGVRAILVPFAAHEETEQTARAVALEQRGLATRLDEAALTPGALAAAVDAALRAPPPARPSLDVCGAAHSAAILLEAAR